MQILMKSTWLSERYFLNAFVLTIVFLMIHLQFSEADEVPAFFLKIAKNVPRIGRSDNKFEDFFFKSSKNIPRIGRRDGNGESTQPWPVYDDKQPFARLSKRRMDYSPLNAPDSWSWQHFPLAIEGPKELWRTLAGYSTDSEDEIDNEIWERQKRTGNVEEQP